MPEPYYKPCPELSSCLEVDKFWTSEEFDKFFEGYLKIATETGYPLAECQVGFCYLEGIGTEKNPEKAFYWTELSSKHGDRDGQCNLAWIYEEGLCGVIDMEKAKKWYRNAALQNHDLAIEKCNELGIDL